MCVCVCFFLTNVRKEGEEINKLKKLDRDICSDKYTLKLHSHLSEIIYNIYTYTHTYRRMLLDISAQLLALNLS